ncbi:MAG TPA: metallophosphoesterase family protein [Gaiella sp.]|uniref:metallophosphoesterase family protein n=1 Tax=Gaiella sp. TaxID=2663207 RepID=UPI002D810B0F|nr:metallophosphoesterase family protein [Gaiella sp.]HET9285927.1 metallophosphoesterase family protein [Gaiella sp.]
MRVGLIADTHGLLRPEVAAAFEAVDHIVHAGDVGSPEVLEGLSAIAPVTAVWGNVDPPELRAVLPEVARVTLGGARVVVVHGDQLGSPTPERVAAAHPEADLVVFGHSHRPVIDLVGDLVAVNPGSAGRRRFSNPVSVALADLDAGSVSARLVTLGEDPGTAPYSR